MADTDIEFERLLDLYKKWSLEEIRVKAALADEHEDFLTDEERKKRVKEANKRVQVAVDVCDLSEDGMRKFHKELLQVAIDERDKSLLTSALRNCNGLPALSAEDCKKIADCVEHGYDGKHGRQKKFTKTEEFSLMWKYGMEYLRLIGKEGGYRNRAEAKKAFCKEEFGTVSDNDGTFNKIYKKHKMTARIGETVPLELLNVNGGLLLYTSWWLQYGQTEKITHYFSWATVFLQSQETGDDGQQ